MSEFKPHDYFTGISDEYTSREVLQEHVRKTYDQIRELADYIDQMIEELTQQSEEFEENEQGRESAESVRVSNEEERISKDSERNSKIDEIEGNLESKANKKQEDWITPTLLNGFTGDVRYRKTQFGHLEIYGTLISVKPIVNKRISVFSLPSGYRPARDVRFEAPEDAFYSFRNVKMYYSSYERTISVYAGQGGSSWVINVSIPINQEG